MLINVGIISGLIATLPLVFPTLSSYFIWNIMEYWMYVLPFVAIGSTLFFLHRRSLSQNKQETEKDLTISKQESFVNVTKPPIPNEKESSAPINELLEEAHVFLQQSVD